jgi:hypothetical protein
VRDESAYTFYKDVTLGWPGAKNPGVAEYCCAADARTRADTGAANSDCGSVASDTQRLLGHGGLRAHVADKGSLDHTWSNTEAALSYRQAAQASQAAVSEAGYESDGSPTKSVGTRRTSRSNAESRVEQISKGGRRVTHKMKGQLQKDLVHCMKDGTMEPQEVIRLAKQYGIISDRLRAEESSVSKHEEMQRMSRMTQVATLSGSC